MNLYTVLVALLLLAGSSFPALAEEAGEQKAEMKRVSVCVDEDEGCGNKCIIKVHQTLGPGFLESIYRRALVYELRRNGMSVEEEKELTIYYEDHEVGRHRLDLVVVDQVVLELKTVEALNKAHYAQLRSYLKASGLKVGFLVNFAKEKADFRRVDPVST